MEKKILIRIGALVVIACLSMGAMIASSKTITHSTPKACKESLQECSMKEKDTDASNGNDFENLMGKFFSSVSY